MNLDLILEAIGVTVIFIIITTWLDIRLYKNPKTKHYVEEKKIITEKDLKRELLWKNISEWTLIVIGFLICYILINFNVIA